MKLDQKIATVHRDIAQTKNTIASLAAGGHEVDYATSYLASLVVTLTGLLQAHNDARSGPH